MYNDQEISIQDGKPYFLYEFNTTLASYYYTNYHEQIIWNGITWEPVAFLHTEVSQSNEMAKNNLTVSFPITTPIAELFLGWFSEYVVTLTLRRGHFGVTDAVVYWKGRVISNTLKQQIVDLKCESIFTSMRRSGIRARFQRNCRHVLYGTQCDVDKSAFLVSDVLSSVDELILTIPIASSYDDDWFTGGVVELPDGSYRMITSHTGDEITINRVSRYLFDNFVLGGDDLDIILYPGCDRTISTCLDKFDNLDNQGGFKWIPLKNPMSGSSIV